MNYGTIFSLPITPNGGYYATDNVGQPTESGLPYSFGIRRLGN